MSITDLCHHHTLRRLDLKRGMNTQTLLTSTCVRTSSKYSLKLKRKKTPKTASRALEREQRTDDESHSASDPMTWTHQDRCWEPGRESQCWSTAARPGSQHTLPCSSCRASELLSCSSSTSKCSHACSSWRLEGPERHRGAKQKRKNEWSLC